MIQVGRFPARRLVPALPHPALPQGNCSTTDRGCADCAATSGTRRRLLKTYRRGRFRRWLSNFCQSHISTGSKGVSKQLPLGPNQVPGVGVGGQK